MIEWHTKSGYTVKCILQGRSNVFLLSGTDKNILIDGSPGYKWNNLKVALKAQGLYKIDYLILTHSHYDHAENAARIKREYGAKVIVNEREAACLEQGKNILPHGTVFISRFIINHIAPHLSERLNYEGCRADILVDQHFDLKELGFNCYILHTPGHSPGSQSIIIDDEIALTGDAMFGVFPGSIFPPFAENEDELIKSWGRLLATNCSVFIPAHGTPDSRNLVKREFEKRKNKNSQR
jgi:glyoxylase-like metal-dependent hydrolase (beta-lactamase superfamily II)